MNSPAITGIGVSGGSVLAATTDSPFHDVHLGSLADFARNLHGRTDACGADAAVVYALVDRMQWAGL